MVIMGAMGYRKRTSFLAGLTVAQISEFSLIFAGLGLSVGHITEETVGLITLVGLITIGLSTYLILYSHQIYEYISPALNIFQRKIPFRENEHPEHILTKFDVIIIGIGRFGNRLAEMLDGQKEINYLGVDFDPVVVNSWQEKHKNILYGDIEDPELLEQIPWKNSSIIISTVPDLQHSKQLIKALQREKYHGKLFVTAANKYDLEILNKYPIEKVLMPQQMAALNFYNSYIKDENSQDS
jgi:hypothetical protein